MGRMLDVVQALPLVDLGQRDEVYHTCRTLLVHRQEDLAIFDRAFAAFWSGLRSTAPPTSPDEDPASNPAPPAGVPAGMEMVGDAADADDAGGTLQTWSDAAVLATKDFAE